MNDFLSSKKHKQFMALRKRVHKVCSLLNRDCYLCKQMFPEIYVVCPYVRQVEHEALKALIKGKEP